MKNITFDHLKKIASSFEPSELVDSLEFNESLEMALNMLNNEDWEESLQKYGTDILEVMREKYPEK